MSVTSFENSAMKSSFSLSSLPISATPDRMAMKTREFNSLKKKKRNQSTKRLSWGSTASEQKEEFWSILEPNYNYIMDNQLIDNCQDANCELSAEARTWSLKEFYAQFSELYSWLNRIQEKIYGNEDNVTDKTLRAHCKSKIIKKRPFYNIFVEQGIQLSTQNPDVKDISLRVDLLNSKWDTLETVLKSSDSEQCDTIDIQREVKCLKNWIREMESRLQPLTFHKKWSKTEIEIKANEHKVLHKDIENHGKIVSSVVKLCKRSTDSCPTTLNVVTGLERRWHLLFLRSMEWQCYIETYIRKDTTYFSDSDSDEGPAKKQPRLSAGSPILREWAATSDVPPPKNGIDTPDCKLNDNKNSETMNSKETTTPEAPKAPVVSSEDAQFTKSNRNAPNLGTYYFKHVDTDSDMDKLEKLQNIVLENEMQTTTTSETSEEEWTYSPNKDMSQKTPVPKNKLTEYSKICQEVEKLVSPCKRINPTNEPPLNRMLRTKQWLKMDKPEDSCDASSEDEENESIATYRPQTSLNASCIDLDLSDSTPKVSIRRYNPRGIKGQRPSSIACITQLSKSSSRIDHDSQPYSISESALHKLPLYTNMNSSISTQGNNSTSSTVEDSCAMVNEEHSSPLRKKRLKLKKKSNILRKIEASTPYSGSMPREERIGTLVKSGSFSGRACMPTSCERHTVSDPSAIPTGHGFETSTTSGADSDEDRRARKMPLFKLATRMPYGPEEVRDDSPGKFSLNTNEEQSTSSLCDEAWDSYQEKYSSEAYSETHDSDAARKLWEFGEDYRACLGSQSDWSTHSNHSPQLARKAFLQMNVIDSDSETSDLRLLLDKSRNQLEYSEEMYTKQHALGLNQYLVNNELRELMKTCDSHVKCLSPVEKSPEEYKLPQEDKNKFSEQIKRWLNLRGRIAKMQEYRDLQNEIVQLKRKLCLIKVPMAIDAFIVNTIEDLSRDIDFYSAELTVIEEHKEKLLRVNVAVNHFMTENDEYSTSSLKSDVSELYGIWNEINSSAADRVHQLKMLLQSWQLIETRLDQLRGDLREDEQTLGALDSALQGGTFSNQMASSVRGVAKLLSESKTEGCSFPEIFFEGSFSDSGISDEGSEHDLGERDRRLSAIRRLVRQLEVVMAPDCSARVRMKERLTAAEEELKILQNKCRSIIVRTSVSAAAPLSETVVAAGPGGDPGDVPNTQSWFRRVVRASISFQFAIMAILFMACLFEPHCCDNMNNLQLSMYPQLHYVRGPPPI